MFNSNTLLNTISLHVTCIYYKQFKKIKVFINCIERIRDLMFKLKIILSICLLRLLMLKLMNVNIIFR